MSKIVLTIVPKGLSFPKEDRGFSRYIKDVGRYPYQAYTTATCRETLTDNYARWLKNLGGLSSLINLQQKNKIELTLVGNMRYHSKSIFLRALFEHSHIAPLSSTVSKDGAFAAVKTKAIIDPWKVSAVLFVLKYGSALIGSLDLTTKRKRKSEGAKKEAISYLIKGLHANSTNLYSLFGVYLISSSYYQSHSLCMVKDIQSYTGVSRYVNRNFAQYLYLYYKFIQTYKDELIYRGYDKISHYDRNKQTTFLAFLKAEDVY